MAAKKAFTKNEAVIHFNSYDGNGTWVYTRAIVQSCGTKKMTLLNAEKGTMMGCNFRPELSRTYEMSWKGETRVRNYAEFTTKDMTDEEAVAVCLAHGALTVADQNEHYDRCEANSESRGYLAAIAKSRAQLHEPRAIKR